MKRIYKSSSVIRIIGIVMILVSLLLWLYSAIDKYWDKIPVDYISSKTGVPNSVGDWLAFDDLYYSALSKATTSSAFAPADAVSGSADEKKAAYISANLETVRPYFTRYFDKARAQEKTRRDAEGDTILQYFENDFDTAAFSARYASMEDLLEQDKLDKMLAEIDGMQVSGKGPKGKAALKPAPLKDEYRAYYDALLGERGEAETGTWFEFISSVRAMLLEQKESGSVNSKGWLTANFSWDAYQQKLTAVREAEEEETHSNVILELLDYCEKKQNGDNVSIRDVLEDIRNNVLAAYPGEDLGDRTVFLSSLRVVLSRDQFTGAYSALHDEMQSAGALFRASSANTAETDYATKVLEAGYKRYGVAGVSLLWAVAAKHYQILLAGILLILLAYGLRRWVDHRMLKTSHADAVSLRTASDADQKDDILLRVSHLKQYFKSGTYVNKAVDDISFYVKKGEVFGLVGESGCGKTTTGRTIINLYDPTEGDIYFDGLRISSNQNGLPVLKASLRQDFRAERDKLKARLEDNIKKHPEQADQLREEYKKTVRELQQKLNEDLTRAEDSALASHVEKGKSTQWYREKRKADLTRAFEQEAAGLSGEELEKRKRRYQEDLKIASKDNIMSRMQMIFQDPIASINPRMTVREIIAEGLVIQGVKDKEFINQEVDRMLELVGLVREHADRYPHEFSGGQRQRIGIARAIVMKPDLIIADEPISALDVSIQAQVINLLNDLREQMGLTIIFIAHNLSVVKYFSDRIAVMYYGHIVEIADSDELFAHPLHPYTVSLLSAIPLPDPAFEKRRVRIRYDPLTAHDYSKDKPSLREIVPGHFIQCNDAEFAQYQRQLGLKESGRA